MKSPRLTLAFVALGIVGCASRLPSSPSDAVAAGGIAGRDTLLLTWSDDPTTTMTIQWIEPGALPPLAPGQSIGGTGVPRVDDVVIDGAADEWAQRGFIVPLLADSAGKTPDAADFAATMTLGWDDRGLLVLMDVVDNTAFAPPKDNELWDGDAVELFIARADGLRPWQLVAAPPAEPDHPALRTQIMDRRGADAGEAPQPSVAAVRTERGFTLEALLPWDSIGVTPAAAQEAVARLQVYANDRDAAPGRGPRKRLVWHPSEDSHANPLSSRTLALSPAGDAVTEQARGELIRTQSGPRVSLLASPALAGRAFTLRAGEREVGGGVFEARDGLAVANNLAIDLPPRDERWGAIAVVVDGQTVAEIADTPPAWALAPPSTNVRYGKTAEGPRHVVPTRLRPFGTTSYSVQRAELRGLEPDTEYVFQLEGAPEVMRFRTAPATLDRPLVFAEGGDIGTGAPAPQLHEMAASWEPLFGLIGGDLAYSDGRNVDTEIRFYREWHAHMRTGEPARLIPMIPAIGNHEVSGAYAQPREKAPFFFALFDGLYPEHSYATLDFGDYLSLILLDTGHISAIDGEQTAWLDAQLAERLGLPDAPKANPPHVFPVYHIPGYPSVRNVNGQHSRGVRQHWVPVFEKHGVRVVFEHHDHAYKRTHPLLNSTPVADGEGIVYLGDGCWGRTPRDVHTDSPYLAKAFAKYHVIKTTLDGGSVSFEMVDENREKFDEYRYEFTPRTPSQAMP